MVVIQTNNIKIDMCQAMERLALSKNANPAVVMAPNPHEPCNLGTITLFTSSWRCSAWPELAM